jgi:hypothetical protein
MPVGVEDGREMCHHWVRVSVATQTLQLIEGSVEVARFACSTSRIGIGFDEGSLRTPLGLFRVARKIGDGADVGTIFRGRLAVGMWQPGFGGGDLVLTRILWLEGMQRRNENTIGRYIYVHGTNHEELLGRPASDGCVRLGAKDLLAVYEAMEEGGLVQIWP